MDISEIFKIFWVLFIFSPIIIPVFFIAFLLNRAITRGANTPIGHIAVWFFILAMNAFSTYEEIFLKKQDIFSISGMRIFLSMIITFGLLIYYIVKYKNESKPKSKLKKK